MDKNEIGRALRALDGREVARRLAQAAELPPEGVAAGQSVASVAMEALGIRLACPINDVDVFLNERLTPEVQEKARPKDETFGGRLSRLSSRVSSATSRGLDNSGYSIMAEATVKDGYELLRATREGMLNEVFYRRTRYFEEQQGSETALVIKAFDLNCAQIGLDLKTGELAWTTDFEEFLASHELRVMNVATPFHTAARYFKKKQDLGCYGDDELNMAACAMPSLMGLFGEDGIIDGRSSTGLAVGRFGKKTRDQALSAQAQLSPWFTVERPETRFEIWTMQPNKKAQEAIFEKLAGGRELGGEKIESSPFMGAPALMIPNAANWVKACLRPRSKGLDEQLERLDKAMSQAGCSIGQRAYYADTAKIQGPEWAGSKAASDAELRALARLTKAHRRFPGIMWGMGLKEQASAALSLKRMEPERGQKLYGWLEGQAAEKTQELLLDREKIEAFCQNQSLAGDRRLTDPLQFKGIGGLARRAAKSLLRVEFEELVTPNALEREGNEMRHCVGGYASAVEKGRSRIFKVSGPESNDRSTLEASASNSDRHFGVEQHRAFANADPSERVVAATAMLSDGFGVVGQDRRALTLAPSLARALNAGLVGPEKMRTAERLLRLALREASEEAMEGSLDAERARKALERHFPKPKEPASPAPIQAAPKSWSERLGFRRREAQSPQDRGGPAPA